LARTWRSGRNSTPLAQPKSMQWRYRSFDTRVLSNLCLLFVLALACSSLQEIVNWLEDHLDPNKRGGGGGRGVKDTTRCAFTSCFLVLSCKSPSNGGRLKLGSERPARSGSLRPSLPHLQQILQHQKHQLDQQSEQQSAQWISSRTAAAEMWRGRRGRCR
jgi:hypothetical protein